MAGTRPSWYGTTACGTFFTHNNRETTKLLVIILPITGDRVWPIAGFGLGVLLLGTVLVAAAAAYRCRWRGKTRAPRR